MPTECEICFNKDRYINPCGAFNNCQARVCGKCLVYSNFIKQGIWNVVDDNLKCPFCRCIDYKKPFIAGLVYELYDNE